MIELPLIFRVQRVKCPHLEISRLQRESRPQFLQLRLLLALKHISVLSHEDVISLIVERYDAPAIELRRCREHGAQEPAEPAAEPRVEIVEDELGVVIGDRAAARDVLVRNERRYLEHRGGAGGEVRYDHAVDLALVLADDDEMREAFLARATAHLHEGVVF